jgi:hypothetical protein
MVKDQMNKLQLIKALQNETGHTKSQAGKELKERINY